MLNSEVLLDLDDPKAAEKAKSNKIQRAKIKKALKLPAEESETTEVEADAAEEIIEEVEQDLSLNPILIAEVPRSGDRWKQVNFDVQTYQQFFGVTLGSSKDVEFHHVEKDGSLGAAEHRHAVAVKSLNYRFEVGAAQGLEYPKNGNPIVILEKLSDDTFNYILLMPGEPEHTLIQNYIDTNYTKTGGKRRIVISAGDLQKVWPASPLFI